MKKRPTRAHLVRGMSIALAVLGCGLSPQVLEEQRAEIVGGKWTRIVTKQFEATGQQSELCVRLPSEYDVSLGSDIVVHDGRGEPLAMRARVLDSTGKSVELETSGLQVSGNTKYMCFRALSSITRSMPFRAVELQPTATVTVEAITWWSGEPRASL